MTRVDCPHAERCPGCPLIGLPYPEQLQAKQALLARAFSLYPELERAVTEPIVPAEPVSAYRVRAKLVAGAGGAFGLYDAEHRVVDLPECRVLTPDVARAVAALRALAREPGASRVLRPKADGGCLAAVDVREVKGDETELLVSLILAETRASEEEILLAARALARREPSVASVSVSEARRARVLGGVPKTVLGKSELPDTIGGVVHRARPGAFVQTHRGQTAKLHAALREGLGARLGSLSGKRIYDLYGGSGAIGLMLARAGAKVTLIESYAPAAEAARASGLEVIGDDAAWFRAEADAVVVNPPRRGLSARVRGAVVAARPRALAYVSCSPETLARDLEAFRVLGFFADTVRPFDMIPLSDQVETLALLSPGARPAPRVLYEDEDLVAVEKPAHDASLLERVRALPGCERATPLHGLDIDTSGVNLFAKTSAARARWQAALGGERTRKHYLALVRGIIREKGSVNRPLDGRDGERPPNTRYRRVEVAGGHSLVRVVPLAEKKHQIRRHLSGLGHPLIGDDRYGHRPTNRHFEEQHGLDRQLLHLERVELGLPSGDGSIEISSPLPGDFIAVLQRLGFRFATGSGAR